MKTQIKTPHRVMITKAIEVAPEPYVEIDPMASEKVKFIRDINSEATQPRASERKEDSGRFAIEFGDRL